MKRRSGIRFGGRLTGIYFSLSIILAFLMVFSLLPHDILAHNSQTEPVIIEQLAEEEDDTVSEGDKTGETPPTAPESKEDTEAEPTVPEITPDPSYEPSTVITEFPTDVISTSMVLQGTLTDLGSAEKVQVGFEYGNPTNYNFIEVQEMSEPGTFSIDIQALKPGITYHYRALASNSGRTEYGKDITFTTLREEITDIGPRPDPSNIKESNKVAFKASNEKDTEIISSSGKINVKIPKEAVSEALDIELTELGSLQTTGTQIINQFTLEAFSAKGEAVKKFNTNLEITIKHGAYDLRGIDPDSIRLCYLDDTSKEWIPLPDNQFDKDQQVLSATTNHFTTLGEIGQLLISGPGRINAAQVDLHSGSTTFSYPIELPAGPGGFQPKINMVYNSASVDEMKSKRSTASWVGSGWTMHLGRISYDALSDCYFLDFNEGSYQVIDIDGYGTDFATNPDQFFKIKRTKSGTTNDYWEVWSKDGMYYLFGKKSTVSGSTDALQYTSANSVKTVYRWDLKKMKDTNGNEATIVYDQDLYIMNQGMSDAWVRAAYPLTLTYGNVTVSFSSTYDDYDLRDGGPIRNDSPLSTAENSAPKVMEVAHLDNIEIKISNNLVRKYVFETSYTPPVSRNENLGPIYYSGRFFLDHITQYGANGSSPLPTMDFTYSLKYIHRNAEDESTYSGDPGNEAALRWPYLETIESGYGGMITYTYEEKPLDTGSNPYIWTREIVTQKTVTGGMDGDDQTYNYDYITGADENPQYLGSGWDQKYRGFGEVTETDAEENYIKHYYYTTQDVDGKDFEKLNGKEYKTEKFSSSDERLVKTEYDWQWEYNSGFQGCKYLWGNEGYGGEGQYQMVRGMAIHGDEVYVSTYGDGAFSYNRIQVYSKDGQYLRQWGETGDDPGQFNTPKGIAVDDDFVYVADCENDRIQIFYHDGTYFDDISTSLSIPSGVTIAVEDWGTYLYVADTGHNQIKKYDTSGNLLATLGVSGTFDHPTGIASWNNKIYIADCFNNRIRVYTCNSNNTFTLYDTLGSGELYFPDDLVVDAGGCVYVTDVNHNRVVTYNGAGNVWNNIKSPMAITQDSMETIFVSDETSRPGGNNGTLAVDHIQRISFNWYTQLAQVKERVYNTSGGGYKTTQTEYVYDSYGNVITEKYFGDMSDYTDGTIINRRFKPKDTSTTYIANRPTWERVYTATEANPGVLVTDVLSKETYYYYDNNNTYTGSGTGWDVAPTKGSPTRLEQKKDAGNSISSYYTYDSYGNKLTEQDPNTNTTTWTYDSVYHIYPVTKTYPTVAAGQFQESYSYDPGSGSMVAQTDINGGITLNTNDTFKRITGTTRAGEKGTFGLDTGSSTSTTTSGRIYLSRFQNNYNNGILTRLELKISDSTPNGNVRLGIYAGDAAGNVGSLLFDAGAIAVANGWIGVDNIYLEVDSGAYYWLAFNMSSSNVVSYQSNYGANTSAYKSQAYGSFPSTLSGVTKSTNPYVMRATVYRTDLTPSVEYEYNDWGTIEQQNIKVITNIDASHSLWQTQYFDGLGRVIQTQTNGESGHTIITGTTVYNNRGQVDKQYVPQDIPSVLNLYYDTDIANWKYTTFTYDALGRTIEQTNADSTVVSTDFDTAWKTTATDPLNHKKNYYYDAYHRLITVEELNSGFSVYATTQYTYDILGNLVSVIDDADNTATMTYDWLSRKTAMSDPDMGNWSYTYDGNSNLLTQTDSISHTITLAYDALNRLTGKTYPAGLGMTNVSYAYDSVAGGNYGKGRRTGMSDALGANSAAYVYDIKGRLSSENKVIDAVTYTTSYTYDGADRLLTVTYPGGEVVTNDYNGRGLPDSVYGTSAGNVVNSTLYNALGSITDINFGNPGVLSTTYGYYGTGGNHDTAGGYYGRLWEIKTVNSGSTVLQDIRHTWDAVGNLNQRQYLVGGETETYSYDFLDRLTGRSSQYPAYYPGDADGNGTINQADSTYITRVIMGYSPVTAGCDANQDGNVSAADLTAVALLMVGQSLSYDEIGNIVSMDGVAYSYGNQPHAVTEFDSDPYATYDSNGNMTSGEYNTMTWDVENRLTAASTYYVNISFVYDGDGNRVKKIYDSQTTVYVNKYYEKNTTTAEVTTSYYLGSKMVAQRKANTLSYIIQDHLGSTTVTANSAGTAIANAHYSTFGFYSSWDPMSTDRQFTGQRLDETDGGSLYYYGARYYSPSLGRFISPDTVTPDPMNPQSLNRYSYCLNNPLKYTDPTGMYFAVTYPSWVYSVNMMFNWNPIEDAYNAIMNNSGVSSWVKDYMKVLHDSSKRIEVSFGNLGGEAVGLSSIKVKLEGLIPVYTSSDMISLDSSYLSNSGGLSAVFAHECYHISEGNPGATIKEEFTAYSAQNIVEQNISGNDSLKWIYGIQGGLGTDEFLKNFKQELIDKSKGGNASNVYNTMPLRQSGMTNSALARQGLVAAGWKQWQAMAVSIVGSGLLNRISVTGRSWK
jgi:RHS repeat-associated protein